jgi:hypothetical protein
MSAGWEISSGTIRKIFAGETMTQIGEPIHIGMVDVNEVTCPFDHDNLTPPTVENDLVGKGGTLANRMKKGESTFLYEKYRKPQQPIDNPRNRDEHPFKNKAPVVGIEYKDIATGETKEHRYPVTCAAHHLIPAQESLKNSFLLTFMVKKKDREQLKDKTYSTGSVWADVGYDVNGSENGVYLPGSYAVGGGRGGLGLWAENDDNPDPEEENANDSPSPASPYLTGDLNEISLYNRKWFYVSQAMYLAPGQFHDRHEDYSKFVAEVLAKIFSDYRRMLTQSIMESQCPKCKDKKDKLKDLGIPTPFSLVARLNNLSNRMCYYVNSHAWALNIYTSKWGKAFMVARKAGNPAAKLNFSNISEFAE